MVGEKEVRVKAPEPYPARSSSDAGASVLCAATE